VVEAVRELFSIQRVGHCGTLDPLATGLLVLLLGEVTKVAKYLTDEDKQYEGQIRLGIQTDTDDAEGKVIHTADAGQVELITAQKAAKKFIGQIVQTPPRFSAQKRQGVRAYERARAGETFETEARTVTVHDLELSDLNHQLLNFSCRVGKGTYVRSLARDLGIELGVFGHVSNLRRTASGGFHLPQAISIEALSSLTMEERITHVRSLAEAWQPRPMVTLNENDTLRVREGKKTAIPRDAASSSDEGASIVLAVTATYTPVAIGSLVWDPPTRSFIFAPERNLFC